MAKGNEEFQANLKQWYRFCSWARWYPDLFLDLIKPEKGGINLHLDQRVFLRAVMRFVSVYGVFPRGWSKTAMMEPVWFEIADVTLTAGENTIVVQWIAGSYSYFLCGAAIHK